MRTIIYHGGCPDGLTAAWLLQREWGGRTVGYQHGGPVPDIPDSRELWIVDLAFPLQTLQRWSGAIRRIFVLDHHSTSAREHDDHNRPLDDTVACAADPSWRGISVTIDQTRSGCGLAAETILQLHPRRTIPEFVYDVEDRDLWRWQRDGSREVCFALERHFQQGTFQRVAAGLEAATLLSRSALQSEGRPLAAAFDNVCTTYAAGAQLHTVAGHRVPLARSRDKRFGSETANLLLKLHPDAPFAGYIHDLDDGSIAVGLRSEAARLDVAHIAEQFGGGGHRNAAGLTCIALADLEHAVDPGQR